MEIRVLPISALVPNNGQLEGLPRNPRFIRDEKYKKLVKSMREHPLLSELRELIVYPLGKAGNKRGAKYMVCDSNQRLKVLQESGDKEVVCKVLDKSTTIEQIKAYVRKSNNEYGEFDFDMLANEFGSIELEEWDLDLTSWEAKEQDFDGVGGEIDITDFDEEMKLEIKIADELYDDVKARLHRIDNSPEMALLRVVGYTEDMLEI